MGEGGGVTMQRREGTHEISINCTTDVMSRKGRGSWFIAVYLSVCVDGYPTGLASRVDTGTPSLVYGYPIPIPQP